jgi:Bacterial Ig-like domain (group 3)/MBG domain (YGX type)
VANYFDHLALVGTSVAEREWFDRSQDRARVRKVSALNPLLLLLLLCANVAAIAQVNVYTRSYNVARTGANLQETILTPANVNSNTFGKLFTVPTDGEVYAQPLYVSNLAIAGGTHNVVFVASMRNTVYAIDADNGTVYWNQNFGTPINPQYVQYDQNISWYTGLGILSTPVIDPSTNIMYFVSATQSVINGNLVFQDHLNALEIATGAAVLSPANITATYSTPDLTNPLQLVIQRQNQRPALTLANGNIYVIFGSHDDIAPYDGWVLAYNKSTLAQVAVYATTTIGSMGGIWMAGQGPVIDSAGNLYLLTGNGSSGKTPNGLMQTGESIIKLSPSLQLLDYFTPYNAASLTAGDMDLGSAGLLMLPNTNYLLGGGKAGVLYLANTNGLGGFNASTDQVRQEFQAIYGQGTSHIHGTPSYFDSDVNGPTIYVWGENDVLRSFLFNSSTGLVNTNPWAKSTMTAPVTGNDGAMPGGFTSISANGNSNGILWASTPYSGDAAHSLAQGVLYAFDANTLKLLWSDKTNDGRDEIGLFSKYCPPLVANGKMYVPNFGPVGTTSGSGSLVVYGLLVPELTVNVANATMTAGSALPNLTGTVSGLQNGDTLGTTINVTYSTTATSNSPAGTYAITATVTGSSAKNYQVVVIAGTLTITAPSTPTTTTLNAPGSATYGANVTLTATVTSTAGTPGGSVIFYNGRTALGAGTLTAGGVATLTTNTLPAGTDNVTATYEGAGSFTASTSPASSITINPATQTITFAAIGSRAYGSGPFAVSATSSAGSNYPVTITVQSGPAVINGGTVTLTGVGTVVLQGAQVGNADYNAATATQSFQATPASLTVTATNASRAYGAANPAFSGTVTGAVGSDSFTESFTTTAATNSNVGGYPIVPSVTGTNLANYNVTIVNGTLTVTAAATTTALSGPGSAVYGANVTLTATVTSTAGTPAGTVTFHSGNTTLGTGTLNGSGVATLGTTALAGGSDSVTASYAALGNFGASTSTATTITVTAATQTITFPAITSRAYGSAPFAVTATSSAGSNYPVTIAVQAGPAVISGGTVTLTGAGTVVLLASQAGDANYSAATATQSFQVTSAVLTVTANNASRAFGAANPAFSGTVTGAVGNDSFSETFTTTATTTSNLGSYPIAPSATGTNLGNYTVTIVNGALTVSAAATTTTLSAPGSAAYGAGVTLTATVSSTAGTPGGIVTFYSGSTSVGTGSLNGSGVATLTTTTLPVGTDTLTASYGAAGNFAASTSPSSSITVNLASQTIAFPAITAHAYGSAPFAVTASSNLGSSYPVTITVQSGPAMISGGIVTVTGVGTVVLQATQAGNTDYNSATSTQSFQVTPALLTVAANNVTRTFDTANPTFSGTITGAVGSDSFSESFTSTATTSSNVGSYPVVPAVTGTRIANYSVSIVNGTLQVTAAATTTTLSVPGGASYGASVALSATVTSAAGVPGGPVTFYSGSTPVGVGTLNGSGVATLNTAALPAGSDTITASYAALGNFAASTSQAGTIAVKGTTQTITFPAIGSRVYGSAPFGVTASSSLGSGYPVIISVQAGPAVISGGIVTVTGVGTVVLSASQAGSGAYDPATATQSFQVTPAPLTVAANNAARSYGAANPAFSGAVSGAVGSDSFTESFTTTATATSNAGSYAIAPAVTGARLANYTVTTVAGELTVTGAATTTKLNAPPNAAYGASVTLTATVASTAGVPAGSVTFLSGSTSLGVAALNSSGVATLTITTLPAGTDTTIATYVAAGNFAGSSSSGVTLTVIGGPAGPGATYALAANPSTLTIAPGATGKTTLIFTPAGGYSGTIAMSCSNLPANLSCAFDQNQVILSGTNQNVSTGLTINTTTQQAGKDVPSQSPQSPFSPALFALVFWCPGGLTGLAVMARKRKLAGTQRLWHLCLLLAGAWALAAGLSGCGMSGVAVNATPSTVQVTVVGTGTSGSVVTKQTVMLTVNMTSMTPQ